MPKSLDVDISISLISDSWSFFWDGLGVFFFFSSSSGRQMSLEWFWGVSFRKKSHRTVKSSQVILQLGLVFCANFLEMTPTVSSNSTKLVESEDDDNAELARMKVGIGEWGG